MKNQIKYWYKKSVPSGLQKFLYILKNIYVLTKLGLFNFEINKDTRMSQLTWTYANSSDADKEFVSKIIKYINAANNVDLEFDTSIEPDKSRQYEFEYTTTGSN